MPDSYRFVLEAIDPSTDCIAFDASFEVTDLRGLCAILQLEPEDFDRCILFELERKMVDEIARTCNVRFDPGSFQSRIRPWLEIDALPYKVHTGRELSLMLAGTKPLAAFVGEHPARPETGEIPEAAFEPHVKAGRFIQRVQLFSEKDRRGIERSFQRVLYAQPGEEWRIEALLLLLKTAEKSGWNAGFERMEGSLLGYEDWQNDIFMERRKKR